MKVLVNHTGTDGKPVYPYIGIIEDTKLTVLFESSGRGVCLSPGKSPHGVGCFDNSWEEHHFVPLKGEITLSNE